MGRLSSRRSNRLTISLTSSFTTGFSGGRKELLAIGDAAPDFELADHEGTRRRLSSFRGRRVVLSFHGFPVCPSCAFDADRLRRLAELFGRAGAVALCIFKTPPAVIAKYNSRLACGAEGVIALIDGKGAVYGAFMERKAARASIVAKSAGDSNANPTRQLPADFLIDEDGVIVDLFRAEHASERITYERIEAFIPEKRRCRCNRKDCIVPRCRENYEEIRREASNALFLGSLRHFAESARASIARSISRQVGFRQSNVRHADPSDMAFPS